MKRVAIGLLGCGNVGSGFLDLVRRERERIGIRFGVDLVVTRILVRDLVRERRGVDRSLLTKNALEVIDGDCDIVVELIGGVHTAGAFVRRALENEQDVVTANKALLAARGPELFETARRAGVGLGFEASVCGAIPVIRILTRGLAGDTVLGIRGVMNATCNFILSRMESGYGFDDALRLAQSRGFAESDASLDVDGEDAAQKLRILAALAFDVPVISESVTGIRGVTQEAVARARTAGGVIRLVASAERRGGSVTLRVEPVELDAGDVLAGIRDENNAVVIRAQASGDLTFTGAGAGAMPTAAAVTGDVIELAQARVARELERRAIA